MLLWIKVTIFWVFWTYGMTVIHWRIRNRRQLKQTLKIWDVQPAWTGPELQGGTPKQLPKEVGSAERSLSEQEQPTRLAQSEGLGHGEAHFAYTHASNRPPTGHPNDNEHEAARARAAGSRSEARARLDFRESMDRLKYRIAQVEQQMVNAGALSASAIQAERLKATNIADVLKTSPHAKEDAKAKEHARAVARINRGYHCKGGPGCSKTHIGHKGHDHIPF